MPRRLSVLTLLRVAACLLPARRCSASRPGHQDAGARRLLEHGGHPTPVAAADIRALSDPVPEVRHYKVPGNGYTRHSPLYVKQVAWSSAESPARYVDTTTWSEDAAEALGVSASPILTPPISTTVQCIINLTCQFFAVYTVLFLLQLSTRLGLTEWHREKSFASVVETLHFVPMLCVLFMATRMRAVQLTDGKPDQYDLPQWWVKIAMHSCTWSMLALTVLVLIMSFLFPEKGGDQAAGPMMLRYLRDFVMLIVYFSFTAVCIGACAMQAPPQLTSSDTRERVALVCTLCLTVVYFGVFLARASATFANRAGLLGQARRFGNAQEALRSATATVAFAPMLALLSVAVTIRATLGDVGGSRHQLPAWAQACFCICTLSVLLQTACVVATGFLAPDDGSTAGGSPRGGSLGSPPAPGGARRRAVARAVDGLRLLAFAVLCVCAVAVTVGALLLPRSAPASVELDCVAVLAALYFGVCLAQWAAQWGARGRGTADDGGARGRGTLEGCLNDAKVQVQFCPMLCVLLLACLLRAPRAPGAFAAPQVAALVATGATAFLVLTSLGYLLPARAPTVSTALAVLRHVCVAAIYASAAAAICALYSAAPGGAAAARAGTAGRLAALLASGGTGR